MQWFVFAENYGCIFECPDNTEGEQNVLKFITSDMPRDFGLEVDDPNGFWIVRGESKEFVPPSSKGHLV